MVFKERGRSDKTLIEWGRYVDVLVLLSSDVWEKQSRGDLKNNMHQE